MKEKIRRRIGNPSSKKLDFKRLPLRIYNSLTKRKEAFSPIEPGKVRMYTCGLTVNNLMHIGHGRTYIFWDIVDRYLRYLGYDVKHVSNITDFGVDDRILREIAVTGESFQQFVIQNTRDYFTDRQRLGIRDPDIYSLATQHVSEMIELIQQLLDKGIAYIAEDGVYFRIASFPQYGRLSGIKPKTLREGASGRVDKDEYDKENIGDFALWKQSKPGEPYWFSPWGRGRPGWHIECSAMSMKYLGKTIDISGGGEDNIFPHHENSIAQSEVITSQPYVRYWMHVRHLMLNGEKMSKSTGNFLTVREALSNYGAAPVRLFLISSHYRKPVDFNESDVKRATENILEIRQVILDLLQLQHNQKPEETDDQNLNQMLIEAEKRFIEAMNNDFNSSLALMQFRHLIRNVNRSVISKRAGSSQQIMRILNLLKHLGTILLGDLYVTEIAQPLDSRMMKLIELLLDERNQLRQQKNYKRADIIRLTLENVGISIEDEGEETRWRLTIG